MTSRSRKYRSWLERTSGRGWSTKASARGRTAELAENQPSLRADDKARRMAERQARKDRKRARQRLTRALAQLEEEIASLESRIAEIDERMGTGDLPWEEVDSLSRERGELESNLDDRLARWEQISEQLEALGTEEDT